MTTEELIIEDEAEIVEEVEVEAEEEEAEEVEEEEQEQVEVPEAEPEVPKKKDRSAKTRITGLIKKTKQQESELQELRDKLNILSNAERNRSQKENSHENDFKLKEIMEKQKEAFQNDDYDSVQKYNLEIMKMNNPSVEIQDELSDPAEKTRYFKEQNPWYDDELSDPGKERTKYARGLSVELLNNRKYSGWTQKEVLDEVSKMTNNHFKPNRLRSKSPTEGVSNIPANRTKTVQISRDDYELAKKMYPSISGNRAALTKKIVEAFK